MRRGEPTAHTDPIAIRRTWRRAAAGADGVAELAAPETGSETTGPRCVMGRLSQAPHDASGAGGRRSSRRLRLLRLAGSFGCHAVACLLTGPARTLRPAAAAATCGLLATLLLTTCLLLTATHLLTASNLIPAGLRKRRLQDADPEPAIVEGGCNLLLVYTLW